MADKPEASSGSRAATSSHRSQADEIYARMASTKLGDRSVNDIVGGGDPRLAGEAIVRVLDGVGLLRPDLRILDLGCGCGRGAVALAESLDGRCEYVGLDIIPGLISFCRKEISHRLPNFAFYTLAGVNPHYDHFIEADRDDLGVPPTVHLDGRFDVVVAFSVFTHLQPGEALAILRSIHGWLANDGSAVLSSFLLDTGSRQQILQHRTSLFGSRRSRMRARLGTRVLVEGDNAAVAYDQSLFTAMLCKSGFEGIQSIHYGGWRCLAGLHYQDMLVVKKEEPFPADFDPHGYLEANPDVARDATNPFLHYRLHGRQEGRRWRADS